MLIHNKFCTDIIRENGGDAIKELGDAVLAIFPSIPTACKCGLRVIKNLQKNGKGICTKVTVTIGDIERITTRKEPDIYGIPVNLCNRMSKCVSSNSILIEEARVKEVKSWLSGDPKIIFCKPVEEKLDDFGKMKLRMIKLK